MNNSIRILLVCFLILGLTINIHAQNCQIDTFTTATGLASSHSLNAAINKYNHIVLKHPANISFYNGSVWKKYFDPELQGQGIALDDSDYIWFGSFSKGLLKIKDTGIVVFDTSNGLPGMTVNEVRIGPEGVIYIAVSGHGLTLFDGSTFTVYDTSNGLCDNDIQTIAFSKYGEAYLGGYKGCVTRYDGTDFMVLPDIRTSGLPFEVRKMAVDIHDVPYAITISFTTDTSGFPVEISELFNFNFEFNKWNKVNIPFDSLSAIRDISIDRNNFLWLVTSEGVFKFDGDTWHKMDVLQTIFSDFNSVTCEISGIPWFTTNQGAIRFKEMISVEMILNVNLAKLYLYKYNPVGIKSFEISDTILITSGGIITELVSAGKYLFCLKPDQAMYPALTGTYLGDVDNWMDASHLMLAFCDSTYSIVINPLSLPSENPAAKGVISGYVKSTDGFRAGTEPIKDIDVTLRKMPGKIVKAVKTDINGYYQFNNVEEGTYSLLIDLPGLYQDSVPQLTITETDTLFKNRDFEIDSAGIHIGDFSGIDETYLRLNNFVYPNPVSNTLYINLSLPKESPFTIEFIDCSGKIVFYKMGNETMRIFEKTNVAHFPKGIYIIKVTTDDQQYLSKILIE